MYSDGGKLSSLTISDCDIIIFNENESIMYCTLIKKKIRFSSYIRNFRVKQLQSHTVYEEEVPNIWGNAQIFPHIHVKNLIFFFYQCSSWNHGEAGRVALSITPPPIRGKPLRSLRKFRVFLLWCWFRLYQWWKGGNLWLPRLYFTYVQFVP